MSPKPQRKPPIPRRRKDGSPYKQNPKDPNPKGFLSSSPIVRLSAARFAFTSWVKFNSTSVWASQKDLSFRFRLVDGPGGGTSTRANIVAPAVSSQLTTDGQSPPGIIAPGSSVAGTALITDANQDVIDSNHPELSIDVELELLDRGDVVIWYDMVGKLAPSGADFAPFAQPLIITIT